MILIIIAICVFLIMCTTMIFPSWHRILRNKTTYNILLFLSFIFILATVYNFNNYAKEDRAFLFGALCPTTFLLFYKMFDRIIQNKLKRHLYFGTKNTILFVDEETKESTWIEMVIQIFLFIVPLIWFYIGDILFEKLYL